jgi:hypothetical protein
MDIRTGNCNAYGMKVGCTLQICVNETKVEGTWSMLDLYGFWME